MRPPVPFRERPTVECADALAAEGEEAVPEIFHAVIIRDNNHCAIYRHTDLISQLSPAR